MGRYLFFDLDGTLSDTHDLSRATWFEILRPYGIDVDIRFYQENIRGQSQKDALDQILPSLPETERETLYKRHRSRYRDRTRRAAPLPGLTPFLDKAREKGFRLGLVTNAPADDAVDSLRPLGLDDTFDPQVFCDDVEQTKPSDEPYRLALERAGIQASQAITFEDSPGGVQAARAAGIVPIALVTTHHPQELRDAGAALVIGDFSDPVLDDVLDDPDSLDR